MKLHASPAAAAGAPERDELSTGLADRQIEVKFRTDRAGLKRALTSPLLATVSAPRTQSLRSVYFDTASGDLRKNGIVLRIRKNGRAVPVLGVKSAEAGDGPFARKEIEVRTRDLFPNLTLFDENTASELTHLLGDRPLAAQFETRIKRRTISVEHGRSQIEVAFDEGAVVAGEENLPLTEVELELKSGDQPDLYDLAIRLAEALPLRLDFVSKGERGFRVSARETAVVVKADTIRFAPEATLDDAVSAVISHTLSHFVANWAATRETEHPDAVHQMRVALRRLRTALAMFKRALPCPEFDVLRGEAKRIASALGPARECDVFRESAERGPLARPDRPAGCGTLLAAIEERRVAAYGDARALIEDVGTTLFVLNVQGFLARRAWRNTLSGPELSHLTGPAADFARHALDRLKARVRKRGKKLPDLSDEARHELRIALKNLRYGAEFIRGLFGRRREAKAYIGKVSALQEILGAYNDVVTARQFLEELASTPDADTERTSGFILGWNARSASLADEELGTSWKQLKQTKPFWN